jgi:hypothetical protein
VQRLGYAMLLKPDGCQLVNKTTRLTFTLDEALSFLMKQAKPPPNSD